MKFAESVLFTHEGQKAMMALPHGHRFVFVVKGRAPRIAPAADPGRYEIDFDLLPKGELPILVLVVPTKDAKAFERVSAAMSDDMLVQAQNASRRTEH